MCPGKAGGEESDADHSNWVCVHWVNSTRIRRAVLHERQVKFGNRALVQAVLWNQSRLGVGSSISSEPRVVVGVQRGTLIADVRTTNE
mgnify:FL=1